MKILTPASNLSVISERQRQLVQRAYAIKGEKVPVVRLNVVGSVDTGDWFTYVIDTQYGNQVYGYLDGGDILVDFGDGTGINRYSRRPGSTFWAASIRHTYANSGIYELRVRNIDATDLSFGWNDNVIEVRGAFPLLRPQRLNGLDNYIRTRIEWLALTRITSVPDELFDNYRGKDFVIELWGVFRETFSLETIQGGLFDGLTICAFGQMFLQSSIKTIPADLFAGVQYKFFPYTGVYQSGMILSRVFDYTFAEASALEYIPEGLFDSYNNQFAVQGLDRASHFAWQQFIGTFNMPGSYSSGAGPHALTGNAPELWGIYTYQQTNITNSCFAWAINLDNRNDIPPGWRE